MDRWRKESELLFGDHGWRILFLSFVSYIQCQKWHYQTILQVTITTSWENWQYITQHSLWCVLNIQQDLLQWKSYGKNTKSQPVFVFAPTNNLFKNCCIINYIMLFLICTKHTGMRQPSLTTNISKKKGKLPSLWIPSCYMKYSKLRYRWRNKNSLLDGRWWFWILDIKHGQWPKRKPFEKQKEKSHRIWCETKNLRVNEQHVKGLVVHKVNKERGKVKSIWKTDSSNFRAKNFQNQFRYSIQMEERWFEPLIPNPSTTGLRCNN